MNILPKKRWHVRTKDNIARVRKDEAAAREEELKKEEKLKLAESEARVNFLRNRSGLSEIHEKDNEVTANDDLCSSQHIDLFADYRNHVRNSNKEAEKEKKEEQEKYEKKIGYLTYLGQDTNEAQKLKSWYEVPPNRLDARSETLDIEEKDLKTKHNHDPLTLINALLSPDPKLISKSVTLKRKRSPTPQISPERANRSKPSKKLKKEKKHKRRSKEHKKKKSKGKEKNLKHEQIQKCLKIELLRKERLRRETAERVRQEALLAPKESRKPTDVTSSSTPRIVQKYNSQFNPELAKQNIS